MRRRRHHPGYDYQERFSCMSRKIMKVNLICPQCHFVVRGLPYSGPENTCPTCGHKGLDNFGYALRAPKKASRKWKRFYAKYRSICLIKEEK